MGWFGSSKNTGSQDSSAAQDGGTATAQLPEIQGYLEGTWTIDATHSEVSFVVRHMAVSKVRGRFGEVAGTLTTAADVRESTVAADIDVTSITTFNEQRDQHLRTGDFFAVETYPSATFRSTGLNAGEDGFTLTGDLTLRGVTRPVTLDLEVSGFGPDAYGGYRAGFSATGRINRREFGVEFDARLDNGGLVVADNVDLQLDIEAVLNA